MFAVVKTGGKQYRVAANDVITVEKLVAETGATVSFDEVLMLNVLPCSATPKRTGAR